jgi:flagellar basal-body rod protein FlgF
MITQQDRLDTISNNLANVDLTGYKKDTAIQKAFPELLLRRMGDNGTYVFPFGSVETSPIVGRLGTGVETNEIFTNFTQGAFKQTENPFDMAIEGKGFMSVATENGEAYTRNGAFVLSNDGYLVTMNGDRVLGENGPIKLKKNNFIVDQDGVVYQNARFAQDEKRLVSLQENEWEDTERVDRLKLVDFESTRYLRKQGESYWTSTVDSGEAQIIDEGSRPKLRQGFLETSNVNPVTEMVEMIEVNRSYEANQKLIQTEDSLLGRLLNEVIKV